MQGGYQGRGIAMRGMIVLMVAFLCASTTVLATVYKVGDTTGWTIMSYDSWLSGKTFKEGDTLEFVYSKVHNVVEVNEADYAACTEGSNTVYTDGDTKFALSSTGAKYYICSVSTHCEEGMKLSVNVVAAATTTPTSSPTPTTPTTPTTTPTTPSTTPTTPSTTNTTSSPSSSSLFLRPSLFTLFLILGLTSVFFHSS